MPNIPQKKIRNLDPIADTSLTDTDVLPIVSAGVTWKVSLANLALKIGRLFLPAGIVISFANWISNNRVFNVKDFGAIGDGVVDDSVAIQAAIDAATTNGGIILYPTGTYKFATLLVISQQSIIFHGFTSAHNTTAGTGGNTGSVLYYSGVATGVVIKQIGSHAGWGFTAQNMGFRANPTAQILIDSQTMIGARFVDCWADAALAQSDPLPPVTSTATFLKVTEGQVLFQHSVVTRFNIGIDLAQQANNFVMDSASDLHVNQINIRIGVTQSGAGIVITHSTIHSPVIANIQVLRAVKLSIIRNYFEEGPILGNAIKGIDLVGVSAASDLETIEIIGNYFSGQGGNQSPIWITRGQNIVIANNVSSGYAGAGNVGFIKNVGTAVSNIQLFTNIRITYDTPVPEISATTGVTLRHSTPGEFEASLRFKAPAFRIGTIDVLTNDTAYTYLLNGDGTATAITLGGAGDKRNYYTNDTHRWRMLSTFALMDLDSVTGLSLAVPLVVNPAGGTTLLKSGVALANGAAAAAGTLTNAPAAGNPTKWISIDDNGTIRKIPAW